MALRTKSDSLEELAVGKLAVHNLADEDCPICYELLTDPIKTECGHCFCLECAKSWFDTAHTCPSCRNPLYEAPEDWEGSDDESQAGVGPSDRGSPDPRVLMIVPVSNNPTEYTTWSTLEFPEYEGLEFDVEDNVFRETIVDLCLTQQGGSGSVSEIWNIEPDWNGPTVITRVQLRAQALAATITMFPKRTDDRVGDAATDEEVCWDSWADAGCYLLSKLTELWEQKPEQSARALQQSLRRGWLDRLATGGRAMPQFNRGVTQINIWGSFEEAVNRLFVRVIVFAQETDKRYAESLRDSRSFINYEADAGDEEYTVSDDVDFDQEESIDDMFDDMFDDLMGHDGLQDLPNSTESEAMPRDLEASRNGYNIADASEERKDDPSLSEAAERVLQQVTVLVKERVMARDVVSYRVIARALLTKAAACNGIGELYGMLYTTPLVYDLCALAWQFLEDGGCQEEFK